jgi:hypothetical protein
LTPKQPGRPNIGRPRALAVTRRTLEQIRLADLDGTEVGRALEAWKREIIDALGGPANVSPQQETIIELAARQRLLLESIDAWLFQQKQLVHWRRRSVMPAVMQRSTLSRDLVYNLNVLGLERRSKTRHLSILDALKAQPSLTLEAEAKKAKADE